MNRLSTGRVLAAFAVTVTGLTLVGAAPVSADEVTPSNTPPTVSSPVFTLPGEQSAFEPDSGASDEIYAYSVTIGDAETLNDLTAVKVCLYHSLQENGSDVGDGDDTCASVDPANTVELTWTRSTDAFTQSVGASSFWALDSGTPSSRTGQLTDTTASLNFRFTVSEAMREGTWTAKVTATDRSLATAVDSTQTKAVTAYSAITTRAPQAFGTLDPGEAGTATASPTVISNGATTLSMTAADFAGDFVDEDFSFTLKTDGATSVAPAAGQLTYDCEQAASFTEGSATRVGLTATDIGTATASGTAENGSTVDNTCRIKHGGGSPVAAYSVTVLNTIVNV
jgi:hypothetical protein